MMMTKPLISKKPIKIGSKKRLRLAFYGDSPTCITGFATVSRNILMGLCGTGRFDIEAYGINYWGEPHDFPFNIWPLCFNNDLNEKPDPFGRKKIVDLLTGTNKSYDVYFFLNNPEKLSFLPNLIDRLKRKGRPFTSIVYYPIDATPDKTWLDNIKDADKVVAYSEYGKKESLKILPELKSKISIIYHGIEPKDFFPIPEPERLLFKKNYFGIAGDTYLITNVNRNQLRKDIPKTMMAFKEFKKKVKNSVLYLHMAHRDVGGDLFEIANILDLTIGKDVKFPAGNFNPATGVSTAILNKIYNACDLVVSSSTGEGWGFSSIEAMAAKRPCLFPNHTTLSEIVAKGRGALIKAGKDKGHYAFIHEEPLRLRPVIHINDMANKMSRLRGDKNKTKKMTEKAYKWVMENLVWSKHIIPQWVNLIDNAIEKTSIQNTKKQKRTADFVEYM